MKRLACSIALVLGALGCDVSTHCDPGQVYMSYSCFDVPEAGAGGAGGAIADGGETDGTSDGSSNTCAPYEGFGATCTLTSQCTCGLDSCNTFMGANYCTHTHCLADTSICPPGWSCLDVSAFDPVTGSVCTRP